MEDDSPLFSILIVSLNPGEALIRTLKSIYSQEFSNYEVVIKDGGSEENIEEIITAYPGVRLKIAPDSGIFDAMNQAMLLARGRFIQFLNCGDTFYSEKSLGYVADCICRNQDVSFFYGDVHKPRSRSGFIRYPKKLSRYFIFNFPLCHQAWFVDAKVYWEMPFETTSRIGGDDIWFKKVIGGDLISCRKVDHVIVSYEGGGSSEDKGLQLESLPYRNSARRDVFSTWEYGWYSFIFKLRCLLKVLFYDSVGWRLVRCYQIWKQKRESE